MPYLSAKRPTTLAAVVSLSVIVMLLLASPVVLQVAASTPSAAGLLIPLYSSPGSTWTTVIQEKDAHPTVPMTVIINPHNGPGSYSSTYDSWINKLRDAGIDVIGYVPTEYAPRSLSAVESGISAYRSMYAVNGIFLDQMSNKPGYQSYYSSAANYAHNKGLPLVVGNPGTAVPSSYLGTVDSLVVYEHSGLPTTSRLEYVSMGQSPANFAVISYDDSSISKSTVQLLTKYASYIYLTGESLPHPYSTLPSYFHTLVADLDSILPNAPVVHDYTMTVLSVNYHGSPIAGMYTTVSYNGKVVDQGFTPLKYTGPAGNPYTVCVSNYKSTVFSHWDDGQTKSCRVFGMSHDLELIAAYNTL